MFGKLHLSQFRRWSGRDVVWWTGACVCVCWEKVDGRGRRVWWWWSGGEEDGREGEGRRGGSVGGVGQSHEPRR